MKVSVFLNCEGERRKVGMLDDEMGIRFQYTDDFVDAPLPLSPVALPTSSRVWQGNQRLNDGLPGIVADSLTDGWGNLLLDRQLTRKGRRLTEISPLERLCWVGSQGMGALEYEPETRLEAFEPQSIRLDMLADNVDRVLSEASDTGVLDQLSSLNGSSGGARPKIVCLVADDGSGELRRGMMPEPGFSPWLIKFHNASDDRDQGVQEFICSELMRAAGISVTETRLFESAKVPGWFGIRRFDRNEKGKLHMATAAGLLDCDFRTPCLDYQSILALTQRLVAGKEALVEQIKRCAFNFLIGNNDDHAKNFSFLMNSSGAWQVSPVYDMVTAAGMGGEHMTALLGKGKNPRVDDFLALAGMFDLSSREVKTALGEVCTAVAQYPELARQYGVKVPAAVRFEFLR